MAQKRNIFLDAEAIVARNFDYGGPALRTLRDLAIAGKAHLVTTSITIREIESKIRERVALAAVATARFKHHKILQNLNDPRLAPLLGAQDVLVTAEAELIAQLHNFLSQTRTETIPLSMASSEEVFEKYAQRKPPFGLHQEAVDDDEIETTDESKKRKKPKTKNRKSEFPDAFVLSALEKWCDERGEKLNVVSGDSDFVEHCKGSENLVVIGRPGEFVHEFSTEDPAQSAIEMSVRENGAKVKSSIASEFKRLGFYLDDQEGDVDEIDVKEVELEDELSLLEVKDSVATFEVTARIDFEAHIHYDNMETAVYDKEDRTTYVMDVVRTEVERSDELTLTVDVRLDDQGRFLSVSEVRFPSGDIAISADIYDDYR